jgi:hypothetical protein
MRRAVVRVEPANLRKSLISMIISDSSRLIFSWASYSPSKTAIFAAQRPLGEATFLQTDAMNRFDDDRLVSATFGYFRFNDFEKNMLGVQKRQILPVKSRSIARCKLTPNLAVFTAEVAGICRYLQLGFIGKTSKTCRPKGKRMMGKSRGR